MSTMLEAELLAHLDTQLASARPLLALVLDQGGAIRSRDVDGVLGKLAEIQTEMGRRGALERLIGDYRAGRNQGRVHVLIAVLLLEIWLSTYLPRAVGRPVEPRERILVSGS